MVVLAVAAWAARSAPAASAPDVVVREERALMGSRVAISISTSPARAMAARAAIAATLDELAAWERRVSEWRAGSDVARVNDGAGGAAIAVGPDARALIAEARAWAERTGGAFEPTAGRLFEIWDDARRSGVLPAPAAIAAARARVDWRAIELSPAGVRLARPGMRLGLGAIGKGHAAERASARLVGDGWLDHLVDCGGDLSIAGARGGTPWRIAVRHPDGATIATVDARPGTIATSGDGVRAIVVDGVRHGHVIDPRTGWPARRARGVTAFAPSGADALATALVVLGPEAGQAVLDRLTGAWAVWVDPDGRVVPSAGVRLVDGRIAVTR